MQGREGGEVLSVSKNYAPPCHFRKSLPHESICLRKFTSSEIGTGDYLLTFPYHRSADEEASLEHA